MPEEIVFEKQRQYAVTRKGAFHLYDIVNWYNSLPGKPIMDFQKEDEQDRDEIPVVIELIDLKVFPFGEGYQAFALVKAGIKRVYGRRNCR